MAVKEYTKRSNTQVGIYFNSNEFDCPCPECSKTLIDDNLVSLLDKLRGHFGKAINISSGYRCTAHNASLKNAAPNSYHIYGKAADIAIAGIEASELAKYAEACGFKGIGLYSTYIHVDSRDNKKSFWYTDAWIPKTTFGGSGLTLNSQGGFDTTEYTIWNYLRTQVGMTEAGAAGMMGNLFHESGLRSNNLQNGDGGETRLGYTDSSYTNAIDSGAYTKTRFVNDGAGYGLAQWTFDSRKADLYDFMKTTKKVSISDLNAQLEFLKGELNGEFSEKGFAETVLPTLISTNSTQTAADVVLDNFEKPKYPEKTRGDRRKKAIEYLNKSKGAITSVLTPIKPNIEVKGYTATTGSRGGAKIEYIVIHYTTSVTSKAGQAASIAYDFTTRPEGKKASSDFIIDDNTIVQYQSNIDTTYTCHAGDGTYGGRVKYANCIGIEVCSSSHDGKYHSAPNDPNWYYTDAVLDNTVALVKWLMYQYNIPLENVIRHYDVSGKVCPGIVGWNTASKPDGTKNTEEKWLSFKQRLLLNYSSVSFSPIDPKFPYAARIIEPVNCYAEASVESEWRCYYDKNDIIIINAAADGWVQTQVGWVEDKSVKKVSTSQAIIDYISNSHQKLKYDSETGLLLFPIEHSSYAEAYSYFIHDIMLKNLVDLRAFEIETNNLGSSTLSNEEFIKFVVLGAENSKEDLNHCKEKIQLVLKSQFNSKNSILTSSNSLIVKTAANALTDVPEEQIIKKLDNSKKDIINYFREIYDEEGWNKNIKTAPETLNFWFDFMNTDGEMGKYSVKAIGSRSKAVNNDKITAIYFQETPSVMFMTNEQYEKREEFNDMTGYTFIQLQPFMENYFNISGQGRSAKDELDSLLYQHTNFSEQTTLTAIPIYHLQPNSRILVRDDNTGLNGEYIVNKITIPLQYNGTTSITASKAVERIY